MSYSVPGIVEWVHDKLPRYGASSGGQLSTAPSVFDPDISSGSAYWSGISTGALALASLGAIATLFFASVYTVACCRRPKHRARLVAPSRPGACATACGRCHTGAARVGYGLGVFFAVIGAVVAASQAAGFQSAASGSVSAVLSLRDIVLGANNTITGPVGLAAGVTSLGADASALFNAAQDAGASTDVLQLLSTVTASVGTVSVNVGKASAQVNTGASSVQDVWGSVSDNVPGGTAALPNTVVGLVAGLGAAAAVAGLITYLSLRASKCASACFRILIAPALVVAVGVLLAASGGLAAISMVGSDVCAAPNAAVAGLLFIPTNQYTPLDPALLPTVVYYLNGDCAGMPPAGSAGEFIATSQAALASATSLVAVNVTAAVASLPSLQPYVASLALDLATVNANLTSLASELACASVSGVYASLLSALCGSAMPAFVAVWAAFLLASFGALVAACSGMRLVASHPGDVHASELPTVDAVETMRTPGGGLVMSVGTAPSSVRTYGSSASAGTSGSAASYASAPNWK